MRFRPYLYSLALFALIGNSAIAQTNFRSVTNGDWSNNTTWEEEVGGVWGPTLNTPDFNDAVITILSGHTVTVSTTITADELTVDGGGNLEIDGGELIINNGSGDDLTVAEADFITTFENGTLTILAGSVLENQGQITTGESNFNVAGTYQHNQNGGVIPTVTWNTGSTCEIIGVTSTVPTGLGQSFYDFDWNNSGQSTSLFLNGQLSNVSNNLYVRSTGSNNFLILANAQTGTTTVGANVEVLNSAKFYVAATSSSYNLDITGNLNVSSTATAYAMLFTATGTVVVDVGGSFNKSNSGTVNMSAGSGSGTLNVDGDFIISGGTLTETSSGSGTVTFTGSGTQTVQNSGTISNTINYAVSTGSTLSLGTSSLTGAGTFTLNTGANVQLGSTSGTGALQDNIQVSGTKTFSSGSTIEYVSGSSQTIGSGHPSTSGVNTIINNAGATLGASVTFSGSLTLLSGDLTVGTNTLTLNGSLTPNANSIIVGNLSNLVINGTGAMGTFPFQAGDVTFNNFTLNRSSGSLAFGQTVTIVGTITLSQGSLIFNGQTLNLDGTFSATSGGLAGNSASTLIIGGSSGGAFGTLNFSGGGNTVGTLELNRSGGSATLNSVLNVSSALNLTSGTFTNTSGLTLANGAVVTVDGGTLSGSRIANVAGNTYDVIYNSPATTGLELPLSSETEDLNNLTLNAGITLNQDVIVNGTVALISGAFSGGSFTITMEGANWNFDGGTVQSGTVEFNSTTSIGGSSTKQFDDVMITATGAVTASSNVSISGNLQIDSGGTISLGSTTLTFNGTSTQLVSAGGNAFGNITANGGNTVTLLSALNLTGVLRVQNATTFQSDGNLTLVSTSDGTSGNASVYQLLGGSSVTGDVIVQRYMGGEGRIWRYLSVATSNATVASWQDDFPITGTFSDPSTGTGISSSSPSLYYYDESVAGVQDNGWLPYPTSGTAASNPLDPGTGYSAFIREGSGPTTIDVTGPINQGTINFSVMFTNSGDPGDGWNLLGNPYPATIGWSQVSGWSKTNIGGTIYVRDNGAGGVYRVWNGSMGDLAGGLIAAGQSFWITTVTSPSLSLNENAKVISTGTFHKETATPNVLMISLSDGQYVDNAFFGIMEEATDNYDFYYDGHKLNNDIFDLSTLSAEGYELAINAVPEFCEKNIKVGIKDAEPGNYYLDFSNLESFDSEYNFTLKDNYLNQSINLSEQSHYEFAVTTEPATSGSERFTVLMGKPEIITEISASDLVICGSEDAVIGLGNLQIGVNYQLFLDEEPLTDVAVASDSFLDMLVNKDLLEMGENLISIKAGWSGCDQYMLENEIIINLEAPVNVTGADTYDLCDGSNLTLELDSNPSIVFYNWYEDGTSVPFETTSTGSILLSNIETSKDIYVAGVNASDCEGPKFKISLNLNELPVLEVPQNEILLCNQTSVLLLASTNSNYSEYAWYLNDALEPFEITTEASIMIDAVTSVNIKVSGRNSVGCESQKTNISISQITATEPENLTTSFACGPENAVMLEVGGAPDGFTYNWYESSEAITPVHSSEFGEFLTEPLSSSKYFYVTIISPEGCESLRTSVMAEIFSINITASEDKLISSSDTGNQWFFNGNAIEGATDKEYAPEESGTYTLTITRGTCTLEESVDFLVTSIGENEAGLLTLYPNPVTNVLNVIVSNELIDEGGSKMLILDNSGRIMLNSDIVSSETEVDLGSLSKGVYFIHISNKNQKIIRRIVKE